jgi:hypothetical protein
LFYFLFSNFVLICFFFCYRRASAPKLSGTGGIPVVAVYDAIVVPTVCDVIAAVHVTPAVLPDGGERPAAPDPTPARPGNDTSDTRG